MLTSYIPIESCYLVNLEEDYNNQKLLFYTRKEDSSDNTIGWYNFPDPPTIIKFNDFVGVLFPDIFNPKLLITEPYYVDLKKRMNKKRQELYDFVYSKGKVSLNDFLNHIKMLTSFSADEVDAIAKLELARGLNFKFLDQKGGHFITFSGMRKDHEDKKRFLSAITSELNSNSERIDYLIRHGQTKGNFRELLLRNVLKKYIPNKYTVATGFIEGCKRQCDIIIYDSMNYSPLFKEDDLVVVSAKSVRAVIEVKTTLDSNTLKESLELLEDVVGQRNFAAPFFKGIFAFKTTIGDVHSIAKSIKHFYNREDEVLKEPKEIMNLYQVVDSISILNSHYIETGLLDFKRTDRTIRPRVYSAISDQKDLNISGSCFFSKLFTYLDVDGSAKKDNNTYFEALDNHILYKLEEELTEEDWIPRSRFHNEHEGTPETIMQRVTDVINWQQGFISISELEHKYFSSFGKGFDPEHYYKPIE